MTPRLPLAGAAALSVALVLTACSAAPQTEPTADAQPPATEQPAAQTPVATAEPADEKPAANADPTCETIISDGIREAFDEQGWTAKDQEFRIGEIVLEDGLSCRWADYSTATDHGQIYGWAPIDAATSAEAQNMLLEQGWQRVEGEEGYITEDPDYAFSKDEEGFGMTYQFGDGWVKLADTKQGIILIDWE